MSCPRAVIWLKVYIGVSAVFESQEKVLKINDMKNSPEMNFCFLVKLDEEKSQYRYGLANSMMTLQREQEREIERDWRREKEKEREIKCNHIVSVY